MGLRTRCEARQVRPREPRSQDHGAPSSRPRDEDSPLDRQGRWLDLTRLLGPLDFPPARSGATPMQLPRYIALVEYDDAANAYGAAIPDFPGCNAMGATIGEVEANAIAALAEIDEAARRRGANGPSTTSTGRTSFRPPARLRSCVATSRCSTTLRPTRSFCRCRCSSTAHARPRRIFRWKLACWPRSTRRRAGAV